MSSLWIKKKGHEDDPSLQWEGQKEEKGRKKEGRKVPFV